MLPHRMRRAGASCTSPTRHVIHIFGASTKKKVPAETRIEYHRSLYHFFRKNQGVPAAAAIVALRVAKGALYVVTGALSAPFSARARDRWIQSCKVFAWHLRGCPASAGLKRLRTPAKAGSEGHS